jgi:S-adenosylmethionine decarboxylase
MAPRSVLYSADLTGCEGLSAVEPAELAQAFAAALQRAGGTIVERVSHHFPGAGLTCVLVLSESHAVLHTWPELGTVNVDIFSCSPRLRGTEAIAELEQVFRAAHVTVQQSPRAGGAELSPGTRDA